MAWVDDKALTTMQTQGSGNKHNKHGWDSHSHTMSYVGTSSRGGTDKIVKNNLLLFLVFK